MTARVLTFFVVLMCGLRKNPIDFGACRVISNCALLTLLIYFHFTIIYAIGYTSLLLASCYNNGKTWILALTVVLWLQLVTVLCTFTLCLLVTCM